MSDIAGESHPSFRMEAVGMIYWYSLDAWSICEARLVLSVNDSCAVNDFYDTTCWHSIFWNESCQICFLTKSVFVQESRQKGKRSRQRRYVDGSFAGPRQDQKSIHMQWPTCGSQSPLFGKILPASRASLFWILQPNGHFGVGHSNFSFV